MAYDLFRGAEKMKQKYYASNDGENILQVITTLGQNRIMISVGNSKLDWKQIVLNEDQTKGFKQFMRENDV